MKTICPPGYHDVRFTFVRSEHSVCRGSHFNSIGHNGFLNNVSITLIDKTDRKNP